MEQDNLVTIEFQIDERLAKNVETVLFAQGLTPNEAVVLYYQWCVAFPDIAITIIKHWMEDDTTVE